MSSEHKVELKKLKKESDSFLSLHFDDPILRKLETYRLYQQGLKVTDIAEAFGFSRQYLYEMWHKFETQGTIALVNKNWGTPAHKLTSDLEAAIIRAKALNPERSDNDLAQQFSIDRSTVYRLLKEHGIQDLHRVKRQLDTFQEKS